jgi:hypothetical protein
MAVIGSQLYSFRYTTGVFTTVFQPDTPAAAALAAIEAKLTEGHADFLAGQYQPAIDAYHQAAALIYGQLHPQAIGGTGTISISPVLFSPMLSLGLEWMNVLAPTVPVAASRPRILPAPPPADPAPAHAGAAQTDTAPADVLGLRSQLIDQGSNADAAADWQYSQYLQAQANPQAAQFYLARAEKTAPALIKQLQAGTGQGNGGRAVPAGVAVTPAPQVADGSIGRVPLPPALTVARSYGVQQAGTVSTMTWAVGDGPPVDQAIKVLYESRVTATDLTLLRNVPTCPADLAADLPRIYFYVIPLALAECYHALGDYADAETQYLQAASYQYLNTTVEAPYLWARLGTLYLDWGDSLFRQGDAADALPIYSRVINPDDTKPASVLYTTVSLQPGAAIAEQVLADLADITTLNLDPDIVSVIAAVRGQLAKISGGLDFWGFWTATVPIWTFDYLQGVAVNFAQLAVSVERDVINFWDRADQATLTRQQLATSASAAGAEVSAAQAQVVAAQAQLVAYQDGAVLAAQRAADATANAGEYATESDLAISYQASSAQISGGDDGDPNTLNQLADQLLSGQGFSGSQATVAAATQLAGAKANRQYEVDSLRRQAAELATAQAQANAEAAAAGAQTAAAQAAYAVASIRAQGAAQLLSAFDNQTFTADVWQRMGDVLYRLYQRYLSMALYAAKLMQQAYNFETDQALALIKADYSTDEVNGLLAADALLADIESFTYDLVSSARGKPQPVKQTISLAGRYPFSFESQLRSTGAMDFQTTLDDFDSYYPGAYAGRVVAVEVDVDGLVPPTGVSGSLTNSGISVYRLPFASWPDPATPAVKYRVQSKETLVISDYTARDDSLLIQPDSRQMRIFEGAGVASSWHLELPKAINDIDYGALLDVRLTFYYQARYDPSIAAAVNQELATRPGFTARQRAIPLRWIYPDAFFAFQASGTLSVSLSAPDFRNNETQPQLTAVGVVIATDGSVRAGGLNVALATPAHAAPVTATLDGNGLADSGSTGSPWAPLAAGTALGQYAITLAAADNPSLAPDGTLDLAPIVNVALLMNYTFTPRS